MGKRYRKRIERTNDFSEEFRQQRRECDWFFSIPRGIRSQWLRSRTTEESLQSMTTEERSFFLRLLGWQRVDNMARRRELLSRRSDNIRRDGMNLAR